MPGAAGAPPGGWTARLLIHPSAFVAPGAIVVGTVTLGARSSVWFNTVVRGDTARGGPRSGGRPAPDPRRDVARGHPHP
ncbi:MAG TPA: hypothetical protein VI792_05290, partial [Candidatus Eisenbacteria bacterium]